MPADKPQEKQGQDHLKHTEIRCDVPAPAAARENQRGEYHVIPKFVTQAPKRAVGAEHG